MNKRSKFFANILLSVSSIMMATASAHAEPTNASNDAKLEAAKPKADSKKVTLPAPAPLMNKAKMDWSSLISYSDRGGHVMGNPQAEFKVVEYASYTCGHCATFEINDAPKIKDIEVSNGKVSFELRNLIRDGIDLTVAALARCGPQENFFKNHQYWMANQEQWIVGNSLISQDTETKAQSNDLIGFITGVYTDMRLKPHALKTGISDSQARACLADQKELGIILGMSDEAIKIKKIPGTPSFLINETYNQSVHSYATLKPFLIQK